MVSIESEVSEIDVDSIEGSVEPDSAGEVSKTPVLDKMKRDGWHCLWKIQGLNAYLYDKDVMRRVYCPANDYIFVEYDARDMDSTRPGNVLADNLKT